MLCQVLCAGVTSSVTLGQGAGRSHPGVCCRGLLSGEEVRRLRVALESDDGILKHSYSRDDGAGRVVSVRGEGK